MKNSFNKTKFLKKLAEKRKNPKVELLGHTNIKWRNYVKNNYENFELCKKQPEDRLEIWQNEDYPIDYKQYFLNELDDSIKILLDVENVRVAVMENNLDWHMDSPFYDRFLTVVYGNHDIIFESNKGIFEKYNMKEGQLWYINGSFKHSVVNKISNKRIAVLGLFNYDKTKLLRTTTTK